MRIVLLGPPGSGKAELSQKMSEHFGMPVITVNSVMQRAAAEPSELGRLAKEAMEQSRVSDELLLALLRIQVPQMDLSRGFVLVDFPKNAGQADVLDSMLSDLGAGIEIVLNLEVDPDELMERLVGRITCDSCGAQYNLYVNPPMVDGVCDACGARVVRRPDDYEETISNRLRVYEGQMGPLLQYYQLNDKLHRVEADRGVDQAWKIVSKLIKSLPPSVPPEKPSPVEPGKRPAQRPVQKQKAAGKAEPATKSSKGATARAAKSEKAPPAKKTPAKSAATKAAPKPMTAKKGPGKTPAGKTASKKKAVAKKAAAQRPAKKVEKKKVAAKRAAAKKPVRKTLAKKKGMAKALKTTVAKKASVKKSAAKKKVPAKKAIPKKQVAKKKAKPKRPVTKKSAAKKVAVKKKSVVKSKQKAKARRR